MTNYVVRKEGMPEIFDVDDGETLNAIEILQEKYPYIINSMKDEEYTIEERKCRIFKEILYENKVVGFCTYTVEDSFSDLTLISCYVLPEYRGHNLLYDELKELLVNDINFSVYMPNNLIMDLFIKYGFAKKLNDYLVASAILLEVPKEKYISNSSDFQLGEEMCASNLYDSSISATLYLVDISSPDTNIICYSKLTDSDIKNYDAQEHRNNLKEDHFTDIKRDMHQNNEVFADTLIKLKEELPKPEFDVYELVGKPPKLSSILESLIDEGFERERMELIQEQLLEEYDEGIVRNESLLTRLKYLLMEDELLDDFDIFYDGITCPYCYNPISLSDISCNTCGYNLQYVDNLGMDDFDMDYITDAFHELLSQIIENNDQNTNLYTAFGNKYSLNDKKESENIDPLSIPTIKILNTMENNTTLEDACKFVSYFQEIPQEELMEYIIDEQYVTDKLNNENWKYVANNLKIPELKNILRNEGLKVSGKKQELIERIQENVDLSKYNVKDLLNTDYIISTKAKEYMEENNFLLTTQDTLNFYNIWEYKEYLDDNDKENTEKTQLEFLQLHEEKALKEDDMPYYLTVLKSKRTLYNRIKSLDEEEFKNELKIYSINLNSEKPFLFGNDFAKHKLETDNIKLLRKMFKKIRYNYESMLIEIYDKTPYEKEFTLDNSILILGEILQGKNLNTIRKDLYMYLEGYNQVNITKLDDFL